MDWLPFVCNGVTPLYWFIFFARKLLALCKPFRPHLASLWYYLYCHRLLEFFFFFARVALLRGWSAYSSVTQAVLESSCSWRACWRQRDDAGCSCAVAVACTCMRRDFRGGLAQRRAWDRSQKMRARRWMMVVEVSSLAGVARKVCTPPFENWSSYLAEAGMVKRLVRKILRFFQQKGDDVGSTPTPGRYSCRTLSRTLRLWTRLQTDSDWATGLDCFPASLSSWSRAWCWGYDTSWWPRDQSGPGMYRPWSPLAAGHVLPWWSVKASVFEIPSSWLPSHQVAALPVHLAVMKRKSTHAEVNRQISCKLTKNTCLICYSLFLFLKFVIYKHMLFGNNRIA